MPMPVTNRQWMFLPALIMLTMCGAPTQTEETNPVVLTISSGTRQYTHSLAAFQFFVKQNYPEVSEPMDAEMLSYIFDRFRRDVSLEAISQAYGIRITADQVERFIKENLIKLNLPGNDSDELKLWHNEVKRRMAIRELLQRKVLKNYSVRDEDVAAFYEQNEERFKKESLYRLRFAKIADAEKAEAFRKQLKKSRKTFTEIAPEFAENDLYTMAMPMFESELGEPFKAAVTNMKPGRYSKALHVQLRDPENTEIVYTEYFYVIYLESIIKAVHISYEDAYHWIAEELQRQYCRDSVDKLLKDFHQSARFSIEVHTEHLPFNYVEEPQEKEVRS